MKFSQFRVLRSRSQRFALIGLTGLLVVALASGPTWLIRSHAAPSTVITPPTTGAITVFPVPTSSGLPTEITAGPDGNLWFIEYRGNKIGRITRKGAVTEFPIPTSNSEPNGITAGPDGNVWFTEESFYFNKSGERIDNKTIGRITPREMITEFPLLLSKGFPSEITAGPDGNLWFTEYDNKTIGRITPKGMITEFPLPPTLVGLNKITTGPDGNLWFTAGVDGFSSDPSDERYHGKIGRITIGK